MKTVTITLNEREVSMLIDSLDLTVKQLGIKSNGLEFGQLAINIASQTNSQVKQEENNGTAQS
jgi:hypothetical protein